MVTDLHLDARWVGAWLALLVAAVTLSVVVALDDVLPGELRILREIQTWDWLGGESADAIRFMTTTQVVVFTGVVVSIALWFLHDRQAAVVIVIGLVLLEIAQPLIKEIVDRPRPSGDVVDIRGSITSPSFPAGHVMSPTVLYGALIALAVVRLHWPSVVRAAVWVLGTFILLTTGLVNLYLGVHWPTDVLGGWLWGAVVVGAAFGAARLLATRR